MTRHFCSMNVTTFNETKGYLLPTIFLSTGEHSLQYSKWTNCDISLGECLMVAREPIPCLGCPHVGGRQRAKALLHCVPYLTEWNDNKCGIKMSLHVAGHRCTDLQWRQNSRSHQSHMFHFDKLSVFMDLSNNPMACRHSEHLQSGQENGPTRGKTPKSTKIVYQSLPINVI